MADNRHTSLQKFLRNTPAVFAAAIIVAAVIIAVFAYRIAPDNSRHADRQTVEIQSKKPGFLQQFLLLRDGSRVPVSSYRQRNDSVYVNKTVDDDTTVLQSYRLSEVQATGGGPVIKNEQFFLGTDALGRDLFSRLIIGTRISLTVGIIAVLISLFIGIFLGSLAGYFGGKIDTIIMWLINITWSIPSVLLVFAFTMLTGKGYIQIFIAVGLTLWVGMARLVRGLVMAAKKQDYVQAAISIGAAHSRIILRHILPDIAGPIAVLAAGNFASAIIIEAGLSFLGVGVQPPQPSWGLMIRENYNLIITNNVAQALAPGVAIMILVLAFNLLGNGIRDAITD